MAIKFQKLNIALVSILALAFFAFAGVGQAKAGELDIVFSNSSYPYTIFDISNFLPGDSADGWASVRNASTSVKKIIVWTASTSNPFNDERVRLGDKLTISITGQGGRSIYNDPVTKFLNDTDDKGFFDKYIVLNDNLPSGNSETYDFKIYFDPSAGNEYQTTTVGFDLNIGSWSDYQNNTPSGHTFLSSGGGSAPLFELEITNVGSKDTGRTDSTISWNTNELATTQIIYSRNGQPHTLTNAPPYYGYANVYPLPEDKNFTYHHQVFLTNLTPCSTYYYRVVSHMQDKGDTVSRPEQWFTTACPGQEEQEGNENSFNNSQESGLFAGNPAGPRVNGASTGDENSQEPNQEGQGQPEQEEQNQPDGKKTNFNLMASLASMWDSLGFGACWPNFPWWLFLLFAVYPIFKGLDYWNSKRDKSIVFSLVSLIPIITAIWAYLKCLPWWLFIIFLIATVIIWMLDRPKKFQQK